MIRVSCGLLLLVIGGCATRVQPVASLQNAGSSSTAELVAAIKADAARSDHESDAKIRGEAAAEASRDAAACLAREPQSAACLYGQAVALGLEARTHPARAGEILNSMLDALARAESADAAYDEAGPARVRALVLTRAPGWPLGPGDAEAGLVAARSAATLRPLYPPNLLTLAEALAKNADPRGARESYVRARDAALALPAGLDKDDWLREADRGLQHR